MGGPAGEDGTCIRDYIHMGDLAAAHLLALESTSGAAGHHLAYNPGNGRGFPVLEAVAAARQVTWALIEVVVGPAASGTQPAGRPVSLTTVTGLRRGWRAAPPGGPNSLGTVDCAGLRELHRPKNPVA